MNFKHEDFLPLAVVEDLFTNKPVMLVELT